MKSSTKYLYIYIYIWICIKTLKFWVYSFSISLHLNDICLLFLLIDLLNKSINDIGGFVEVKYILNKPYNLFKFQSRFIIK